MGALKGSISYTKYYVDGELPHDFKVMFVERVQQFAFLPLTAEDEDEERTGWCSVEHPFDLDLDEHKVLFNEYLNLGLRTDKWRLPGALVKAHTTEAERAYLEEHKKQKISKREKEDIKAVVEQKLKQQLLPTMKVVDVSWNLHRGELRFWTQSAKACEQFEEFFEQTFGMPLVLEAAYTSALECELDDAQLSWLEQIDATTFHETVAV